MWKILFYAASTTSYFYIIQTKVIGMSRATGASMVPTIDDGSLVIINRRKAAVQNSLKHGDVVFLKSVEDPNDRLIKRVVAMEGDRMPRSRQPINRFLRHSDFNTIPRGHIWVMGDNMDISYDSRDYGPVPVALVEGRVTYQIYPTFRNISQFRPKLKRDWKS